MNRREFLRATTAATVGFTVLGLCAAEIAREQAGLIDTNIMLGRWPFRRLPLDDTAKLVARLRHHGVTQAWAGNFDGAFGKDLGAANAWLATECRKRGRGVLLPFGSVNPTLANWEDELRRCHEQHRMPGLRLHPNYHGYKLDDPAFAKMLKLATDRKLIVQIAASLEDERTQPPVARAPVVDAKPLLTLLKFAPAPHVVLLNWQRAVKLDLMKQLAALGVCFDIATVENVGGVAGLIREISSNQVLFGSHAPFFYFESALLKLKESALSDQVSRAVCAENARRLISLHGDTTR